ncbi:MAG: RNA polymerase factor sigma-54 [Gemmatimonadota bacterium]|nr:RNA polymerase factor sigma-54 [Gemmatimonadota bacterium]MDH3424610.1 RNA polymerase factor sigma-54 [Gemmatimonadota bacterium]
MSGFNTKLYQSTQLRQDMRINPRLYQAMELLYMPLLDLEQHLKAELAENPFLEMTEADEQQEVELKEDVKDEPLGDDVDWEEILLDGFDVGGRREQYEHKEFFEPTPVEAQDLHDHLHDQLRMLALSERELRLGEEIIGNIDDSGMLGCTLEEAVAGVNRWLDEVRPTAMATAREIDDADERQRELEDIADVFRPYENVEGERMLTVVQAMDPPGIAARNVQESILIQLRQRGEEGGTAYRLIEDHFDALINHRWNDIARDLSMSPKDVQDAADVISHLDPKPGLKYAVDPEQYVIPDLIVEKIDGEYLVFANDTSLPRLRISQSYKDVARDKSKFTGENKEFIASKLNSANWMVQAIEQRRQTMLKVMNFIVDRQREFFERGVQYLRPLTLREVADYIEMHESTVSRVTNKKFVQTPRGVYSLKYFFSSGLSTVGGEDLSARAVKDKIKGMVAEENTKKPLTDQAIVMLLKEDGVKIARRTVAKYRDQLGILPARMRKRV